MKIYSPNKQTPKSNQILKKRKEWTLKTEYFLRYICYTVFLHTEHFEQKF